MLHFVFGAVQGKPNFSDVAVLQQEVRTQLVTALRFSYLSGHHEDVRYCFHPLLGTFIWPVLEHLHDRLHRLRLIFRKVFGDVGYHTEEVPAKQKTDVPVPVLEPLHIVRFNHDLIEVPLLDYHHPLSCVLQSSIVQDLVHPSHSKHLFDPEPPVLLIFFHCVTFVGHPFPDCCQSIFFLKNFLHLLQRSLETSVEKLQLGQLVRVHCLVVFRQLAIVIFKVVKDEIITVHVLVQRPHAPRHRNQSAI